VQQQANASNGPGGAPGLGVDIDETLAAKWPYQRAYLPVNRKLDGIMHNW
jgi:mannonate dehydratase